VCVGFTLFFHLQNPICSAYSAEYGNRGATTHSCVLLLLLLRKALIIKALTKFLLHMSQFETFHLFTYTNKEKR